MADPMRCGRSAGAHHAPGSPRLPAAGRRGRNLMTGLLSSAQLDPAMFFRQCLLDVLTVLST